mmetsp:Transcript_23355/g.35517  ORF Transcript_23355/g.35517 Transcript_23355/m.35517 type:complete len:89 (+) Transcript_23355:337-603(+)
MRRRRRKRVMLERKRAQYAQVISASQGAEDIVALAGAVFVCVWFLLACLEESGARVLKSEEETPDNGAEIVAFHQQTATRQQQDGFAN